jgi:hypothetical protein
MERLRSLLREVQIIGKSDDLQLRKEIESTKSYYRCFPGEFRDKDESPGKRAGSLPPFASKTAGGPEAAG